MRQDVVAIVSVGRQKPSAQPPDGVGHVASRQGRSYRVHAASSSPEAGTRLALAPGAAFRRGVLRGLHVDSQGPDLRGDPLGLVRREDAYGAVLPRPQGRDGDGHPDPVASDELPGFSQDVEGLDGHPERSAARGVPGAHAYGPRGSVPSVWLHRLRGRRQPPRVAPDRVQRAAVLARLGTATEEIEEETEAAARATPRLRFLLRFLPLPCRGGREPLLVGLGPGQLEAAAVDPEDGVATHLEPIREVRTHALPERLVQHYAQGDRPDLQHLEKSLVTRRWQPGQDAHRHHDLAGEEEPLRKRLLVGPGPEDRREDQALGSPRAVLAKRHVGKPRRVQEPVECLLQGLMMRRGRGMTVPVLMRHARLHRVSEPKVSADQQKQWQQRLVASRLLSYPRKRGNGVGWHW